MRSGDREGREGLGLGLGLGFRVLKCMHLISFKHPFLLKNKYLLESRETSNSKPNRCVRKFLRHEVKKRREFNGNLPYQNYEPYLSYTNCTQYIGRLQRGTAERENRSAHRSRINHPQWQIVPHIIGQEKTWCKHCPMKQLCSSTPSTNSHPTNRDDVHQYKP
jgi:hypothetical protein